ncbi:MAG: D-alanyl-D-alanine carboxypeptidase/D-alanyl-D-alanine-endopeptidase [Paracoccaceae bacterium]
MRPFRRFCVALLAVVVGFVLSAAPPVALAEEQARLLPGPRKGTDIRAELGLTGVSGWMLVDLATGRVLDAQNADRTFAPASVAKLPTAAFALDALGPDYRFVTELRATAEPKGGTLRGDLILRGGGNPELDTDALVPLARDLAAKGVRKITGRLLTDGSALPQVAEIETAQAEDSSYNPSVSGLNLNYNRVHVKWDARSGRNALSVEAASETLSPPVDSVRVALTNAPGAPIFRLASRKGAEQWQMARRAFRGRAAKWLPVKRPDLYAGGVFRTLASQHGISLPSPERGELRGKLRTLARHESRPLGDILRDMLRFSTNLTAEVTGSAATRSVGVQAQTLADSADVMNAWAASVAGFPAGDPGFRFVNHSGLTIESRVSPRRMVEMLAAFARREPDAAGRHPRIPGAIAGYLKRHNVAAKSVPLDYNRLNVVAKTGTMSYVRGLAGYIATPQGRQLAFAIFSNDLVRRGGGAQSVNKRWLGRAKGFERALIRNWVIRTDGRG